ncbi:Xaa-Pro peptidase family protein [Malonomonas rubra]|uniref:M24 family metallopeptidase n=1 Tax=Malonomonas rubra TaxID=57040 RepID=UPI0026ED88D5|nr:Xaa-Pro peptidase family protein [Malonomonas rubra]
MRITPTTELTNRFLTLQNLLQQQQIDAAFLVQNSDLFYFTGSIQQGVYYLPAEGEPAYLVRKDYGRARMESGLKNVLPLSSLKQLFEQLRSLNIPIPKNVGMELDVLPVQQFNRLKDLLAPAEIVDLSLLLRQVRAVKSDYEIGILKDSALIMDKVFRHAKEVIAEGKTDIEVVAELECFARKEGHQGITRFRGFNSEISFGHVFSGPDGAVPTFLDAPLGGMGPNPAVGQGASYKIIAAGEPIIIDLVVAFDGYLVDQTRTMSIGRLPEQLRKAYFDMLKIQEHLFAIAKPGVAWEQIYLECCHQAGEMGYRDHFMGAAGAQVSFVGHGVGIEVDEYPFIARGFKEQTLAENMTFAFEPKVVFPGLGAVGVENCWRVSSDGIKRLTYTDESLVEL